LQVKDEVELTVAEKWMSGGGGPRPTGFCIKKLPPGTVVFETLLQENVLGEVSKEASLDKDDVPGTILVCDDGGSSMSGGTEVPYLPEDRDENILFYQDKRPEIGDKVSLHLCMAFNH
jgi:hypothetical protein